MAQLARRAFAATLILTAAACGGGTPAVPEDVQRDLQAAQAASLELAPRAAGAITVVSPEEQGRPSAEPVRVRRAPVRRTKAVAVAQPVASVAANEGPVADEVGEAVEEVAEVAGPGPVESAPEVEAGLPAPRPRALPLPTPGRRGGYKTTAEVIRDAPFPIHP
jgi:hypothetical protein